LIIYLSLKSFTAFSSKELLIGYLTTFPVEMRGQMGKRMYAMGVIASIHVHMMEERG